MGPYKKIDFSIQDFKRARMHMLDTAKIILKCSRIHFTVRISVIKYIYKLKNE